MAIINLVGLAANDPVPGNYVAVNFAQGVASNGQNAYAAILMGNKTSAGDAVLDTGIYGSVTPVVMDSEQDSINRFGPGSELHQGFRAFRAINQVTPLFAIAVSEGTSSAAATGVLTLTGTATAAATLRLMIEDRQIDVGVVVGDTPTVVAANAVPVINSFSSLGCTASSAAGVLTLTQKQKGLRGNDRRFSASVLSNTGAGLTVSPTVKTNFTGGTVADDNTAALAAMAAKRFYYWALAQNDSTNLGRVQGQLDALAAPTTGLRQRAVASNVGSSPSSVITIAQALNSARMELVFQPESDKSTMQLSANMSAVYSLMETALGDQSTLNFNFFGQDPNSSQYWNLPAASSGAVLSRNQIAACLNSGITPIGTTVTGQTYIVRRVTTRSLNGANPDYRIRDAHKVTVADRFADDVISQAYARFGGKVIGNDPLSGQKRPGSQVVTPLVFKSMIFDVLNDYDDTNLLQNVAVTKAGINCVRETSPSTRISARIPIQVIDIYNQGAINVDEVGVG